MSRLSLLALLLVLATGCTPEAINAILQEQGGGMPADLDMTFRTDDSADRVAVSSEPIEGADGVVETCLQVAGSGWWKGLGFGQRDPSVEGEGNGTTRCTQVNPRMVTVHFWKAKTLGIHTHVGQRSVDLSSYAGHRVTFAWVAD